MNLAIILPTYNCLDYTKRFLKSIKTTHKYKLIVVDNGSTDGTTNYFETELIEDLVYLPQGRNTGVAGGWNIGVKKAIELGCDHFLICNTDILLHEHTIDALVARMEKGGVDLVSPVDIRCEVIVPEDIFELKDKEDSEAPNPNFSCYLLSKKCYESIGPFDEGFYPAFYEDNSWHYKMKLNNLKGITTTSAMFYHFGSRSQNQVPTGICDGNRFNENRQYYIRKWGGMPGQETFKYPFNDPSSKVTG